MDLGRTESDPVDGNLPSVAFTVLSYEGAAPNVSSWRLRGTGLKGVRGVFTAAAGEVKCTIVPSGTMLIVR